MLILLETGMTPPTLAAAFHLFRVAACQSLKATTPSCGPSLVERGSLRAASALPDPLIDLWPFEDNEQGYRELGAHIPIAISIASCLSSIQCKRFPFISFDHFWILLGEKVFFSFELWNWQTFSFYFF